MKFPKKYKVSINIASPSMAAVPVYCASDICTVYNAGKKRKTADFLEQKLNYLPYQGKIGDTNKSGKICNPLSG